MNNLPPNPPELPPNSSQDPTGSKSHKAAKPGTIDFSNATSNVRFVNDKQFKLIDSAMDLVIQSENILKKLSEAGVTCDSESLKENGDTFPEIVAFSNAIYKTRNAIIDFKR